MKILTGWFFAVSILGFSSVFAAAPRLHVSKSVAIDASASTVWNIAKDFNALNTWHPAVAKDELVSGANDTAGTVRLLTLQDGGTIKERLLSFSDSGKTFKYAILESVLPVSSYHSTFVVKSAGKGKSVVTWSGTFSRKNVGDNPAEGENDKTALDAITGVYQSGLDNLKKLAEKSPDSPR